jgi:CRP/FNR family cyclic AMP-dependent transcriptional regulator
MCTEVSVPAGRVLCREGGPGHEFFVLEEGSATVTVGGAQVATFGPGDFFGELALLDGSGARTATVTAESDAQVLVLTAAEFRSLLESEPTVAVRMLPAIGRRLRAVRTGSEPSPPVV